MRETGDGGVGDWGERTFKLLFAEIVLVLVEIEEFFGDRLGGWFVLGVVVWLKVGVSQRVLYGYALHRVEGEELLQEVQSELGCLGEHDLEWNLLLEGEGADVFSRAAGLDAVVIFHGGRAEDVEDEGELMMVC